MTKRRESYSSLADAAQWPAIRRVSCDSSVSMEREMHLTYLTMATAVFAYDPAGSAARPAQLLAQHYGS
jgi:hypothetical protein